MANQQFKIYAAGYFDGEGCIRVTSNKKDNGFGIHVFVTNTYKPFLDELSHHYGGRVSLRNKSNDRHRTQFHWRLSNRKDALRFLLDVTPYLREKYQQAILGIEFCRLDHIRTNKFTTGNPQVRQRKTEIKHRLSSLKKIDYGQDTKS